MLLRLCYLAVDPCRFRGKFIHRTSSNSSSHPSIHPSATSCTLLLHPPVSSSVPQVLKGGIVSNSPIHVFILDPSPKHFVRFIFVRRPPTIIDIQDIRPRDSTPVFQSSPQHHFFFQSLVPRFVSSRYLKIQSRKSKLFVPILALRWNPGKNWLVQRRDAVAKKGDRGVEGRKGLQSQT